MLAKYIAACVNVNSIYHSENQSVRFFLT